MDVFMFRGSGTAFGRQNFFDGAADWLGAADQFNRWSRGESVMSLHCTHVAFQS
jgi:hypothetical protein